MSADLIETSPTTAVPDALSVVRATVDRNFPNLWPAVEAGLSTCATLLLADNVNPVALIYVGPPSAGKTTVARMFERAKINGELLCYRSDKFTPAAFVSQSAQATEEKLKKVDLLPRIQHKVLLTPEMAIVFRGKQDELIQRFSMITRILDGQGLWVDSGTHGRRGYEGDYLFAWIGCTTPFNDAVWKVMAQLGSRLFFLVMDAVAEPTVDELASALSQPTTYQASLVQCREVVHRFLADLFTQHNGVRGVKWDNEHNPPEVVTGIARCARLLAVMRTPYEGGKTVQPESPYRANAVLYNLARGHALVSGRTQLVQDDMPMIARITLSSIPAERRAVLLAFVNHGGEPLTVKQVREATGGSRHTAEGLMEEMEWLGIAVYEHPGNGRASVLTLKQEWAWITQGEFAALLLEGATWQESGDECLAATQ